MFPLSLIAQKNSIIMVKMQPLLDDIKQWNAGDNVRISEEQRALYKREGYSTWKGILPLLVQIPIIIGLINVIYNPLQHLLHLSPETIAPLLEQTAQILGISTNALGAGAQLRVLEAVQSNPAFFAGMAGVEPILNMDLTFFGLSLAKIPTLTSWTILYPILSGVSALVLSLYQNKYNVLQQAQSAIGKWGMTVFLIVFSAFFAYILPCGMGLYWIVGNLLSIPVLAICNKIYDPKKHIRAQPQLKKPILSKAERKRLRQENKLKKLRQKKRQKKIC